MLLQKKWCAIITAGIFRKLQATLDQGDKARPIQIVDAIAKVKSLTAELIAHLKVHCDDIGKLPWDVFEHLVAEFLASWGFSEVKLLGRDPYTGADILAVRKLDPVSGIDVRLYVECKRWKNTVGIEVVDRVLGAMISERPRHGWNLAMIVSLGGFTEMKKYSPTELKMMGIELRDSKDVKEWLKKYKFNKRGLWLPSPF